MGQATVEVPAWANDERIRGLISRGGALATLLARNVSFDRLDGTGLAAAFVQAASGGAHAGERHFALEDVTAALRRDGLQF